MTSKFSSFIKQCFITTVLLLFSTVSVNANTLNLFKKFSNDNPLSYQSVRSITQDSYGFIWLGTQEGLHRYDGYKLKSYHHNPQDKSSLSADAISAIIADNDGQLWIGTRGGGLNLYLPDTDSFQRFNTTTKDTPLSNDNINTLLQASNGSIWAGTENGLNIISRTDDGFDITTEVFAEEARNVKGVAIIEMVIETSIGEIWVATNGGGIHVFDNKGNYLRNIRADSVPGIVSDQIKSLFQDHENHIWIGTLEGGLVRLNPVTGMTRAYTITNEGSTSNNIVHYIYQDSDARLWVATDRGLLILDSGEGQFQRINSNSLNPLSLSNDVVLTIYEDNNNVIWVGTFSGVNRWDPYVTTFKTYDVQSHPTLTDNIITSFAQVNENQVFIGTYSGGINLLDEITEEITEPAFNDVFRQVRIMTLFAHGHELWVGTRASGLYVVNLKTSEVKNYRHDTNQKDSISADSVTDIIRDSMGRIWISTYQGGINLFNGNGSFTRFLATEPVSPSGPRVNQVLQLQEDPGGAIWLATYGGGVSRFNPETLKFDHIMHDDERVTSLSSDLAWTMFRDRSDTLWIGTQAAGINLLPVEAQMDNRPVFGQLNIRDGMKSRTVYGITQDLNGDIWLSSNKGISRFSPDTRSFRHFGTTHGIKDLEFNHGAIFRSSSNSIYFGSAKGVTRLDPLLELARQRAPEVRLTNVFRLNEPMAFDDSLADISQVTFDHKDQLISFEYTGLNYGSPETTRYRYRLVGFDSEWIEAGKLRRATYTNLPAGNYQLRIIAGNSDDVWSQPGLSLDIVVKPAPWNTWWAWLGYVLIVAAALLAYSRSVSRKLIAEQQQRISLKQQVLEKTQDFQQKNVELERANELLEKAATVDKLTGVKSRRYLDIYIEQASRLMAQIHQNIASVDKYTLPRLYIMMVSVADTDSATNTQLLNLTDILLYSRNDDDLVIRWSDNTFAIIGYEKEDNARQLAINLNNRIPQAFEAADKVKMAYTFYPFNREQPMELSWDSVSVIAEFALGLVKSDANTNWLGIYQPVVQPFNYNELIQIGSITDLHQLVKAKSA